VRTRPEIAGPVGVVVVGVFVGVLDDDPSGGTAEGDPPYDGSTGCVVVVVVAIQGGGGGSQSGASDAGVMPALDGDTAEAAAVRLVEGEGPPVATPSDATAEPVDTAAASPMVMIVTHQAATTRAPARRVATGGRNTTPSTPREPYADYDPFELFVTITRTRPAPLA
jgi:hypothetical protein